VFYGVGWDIIAYNSVTIDNSKYSTSKNPSTGLYYILHILNVEVSDLKKHKCNGIMATRFASSPLYTLQLSLLLSNPHCRTASPPCTTYTGVGFDSSLVQHILPIN
jgi:hypothetical protein